jgi:hypothetical protein
MPSRKIDLSIVHLLIVCAGLSTLYQSDKSIAKRKEDLLPSSTPETSNVNWSRMHRYVEMTEHALVMSSFSPERSCPT